MKHFKENQKAKSNPTGSLGLRPKQQTPKLVLIIMGPPGSGKGTQAGLLADRLDLYYLETSKLLERAFGQAKGDEFVRVEEKKYFLKDERKLWETGKLSSLPFVAQLVKEKIERIYQEGNNLILAGSPRGIYEAEVILPLLKTLYGPGNIKVFLLEITAKETIFRNSHRKICELMRHPLLYSKETENLTLCPLDGSKLKRREKLDDPETIKVRLKEYRKITLPVIEYFKKEKIFVKEINGSPPPAEVFEDILKDLNLG